MFGSFWIEEKRNQLGRDDGQDGWGIGMRSLAVVMLSFGPAGILAVISATYRRWKTSQPFGLGLALPGGVLVMLAMASWSELVREEWALFVLALGLLLMVLCMLTVPLKQGNWTMTLAVDGHLLVVTGALAMGVIDEVLMPVLLIFMSTVVWVVGIIQLRKILRIWGLADLLVAIVCSFVFVSTEMSQPTNLLIALGVLAMVRGIVAWRGLANQEELVKD